MSIGTTFLSGSVVGSVAPDVGSVARARQAGTAQALTTYHDIAREGVYGVAPEAWMAGSNQYYVLDVGDAQIEQIEQPTAAEGVILRTSDQISKEIFQQYIGQRVIIEGEYVAPKPFIPQSPMEAYPMGPDRKPLPTGGGFKVYRLQAID